MGVAPYKRLMHGDWISLERIINDLYRILNADTTLLDLITPPGNDGEIIYNDGGAYGADSTFSLNDVSKAVSMQSLIIADGSYIGSVSDTDAIKIEADGDIVMSQDLLVAGTFESTGVATLADASLLKTSAAPTADAMIANKKYVDDGVAGAVTAPGGSDTQVQYNNGGVFGGTSYLTLNDATGVTTATGLNVTGTIATGLDMSGGTFATYAINASSGDIIAAQIQVDDNSTYIDKDGSNNMTFTDAVVGTRTLKQLGCPTYKYVKATGQSEGDLHLSDVTYWAVSKALIKYIRVITASTDWDLYILQNDNGYAVNDATMPMVKIGDAISGNANLWLDLPYEDEDASGEVHLYWISNSGVDTATIIIQGFELL